MRRMLLIGIMAVGMGFGHLMWPPTNGPTGEGWNIRRPGQPTIYVALPPRVPEVVPPAPSAPRKGIVVKETASQERVK
jgi:hypothetical protein